MITLENKSDLNNIVTLESICDVVVPNKNIDDFQFADDYILNYFQDYARKHSDKSMTYDLFEDNQKLGFTSNLSSFNIIIVVYSSYSDWVPALYNGEIRNPIDVLVSLGICPGLEKVNAWSGENNLLLKRVGDRMFVFVPRNRLFFSRSLFGQIDFDDMKNRKVVKTSGFINYLLSTVPNRSTCLIYGFDYANDNSTIRFIEGITCSIHWRNRIPMANLKTTKGTPHEQVYGTVFFDDTEFRLEYSQGIPIIKFRGDITTHRSIWYGLRNIVGLKSARYINPAKDIVKLAVPVTVIDYEEMFWDYLTNRWVAGKEISRDDNTIILESTGCCETDFVYRCATVIYDTVTINGNNYTTWNGDVGRGSLYGTVYYINLKNAPYPERMYDSLMDRYQSYYREYYQSPSSWIQSFTMQRISPHEAYIYFEVRDTGD